MLKFAIMLLAVFSVSLSHAAGEHKTLDEVVVSGSKEATTLSDTPAAIGKVDEKAIDETRPTFIGQVLDRVPGVHMVDLGNEQHSMSIRQPLSYNAVYQYLEDGIPIRPVGIFNHNALYEVNLTGAESIEVLKGPASSLYGSNAVGGAVNFITRVPSLKPEASVSAQGSYQGYRRLDAGASNTWGDFGMRVAGYSAERRGGWQEYNKMDKDSFTLRADNAVGDSALLKTVFTYNKLYTDMPGSLNPDDYDNRPGFSYQTFTWRKVEATRLSTALETETSATSAWSATLYARDNTTEQLPSYLIFNTGATTASGRINDNSFQSLGTDLRHRQDHDWLRARWIVGLTAERSPNTFEESNLAITRDAATLKYTGYTVGAKRRDYEVILDNVAPYTQIELSPAAATRVVVGGRYDYIRYDFTNNMTPGSTTGAPSETRDFTHFSPKAGVVHNLSPALSVFANYSQGFTPPEVSSLYGRLDVPNLESSVFDNYDTGVRWSFDENRGKLDLSVYRLDGKDEVVSYNIAPGNSEPRNAGKTRHEGVELGLGYALTPQWEAHFAGAFSRHTYVNYRTSPTLVYDGNYIPASPKVLANAELAYRPAAGWRLAAEVRFIGKYWMDSANTVEYPGHTLLNLRARYAVGAWEAWFNVLNAADKKYADIASSSYSGSGTYNPLTMDTYSPGAPRTFFLGVGYRFGETASK
jgi:outer membrane receptor protein involved in Fe transport